MLKFIQKIFIVLSLIISFQNVFGQINDNALYPPDKTKAFLKERKQLDQAYHDIGTKKDQEAYNISHKILKKTKYRIAKIQASINLGIYHNNRNLSDSALFHVNNLIGYIGKKNDSISLIAKSQAYNLKAVAYGDKGLFDESKKWHFKGIELAQKLKNKKAYYVKIRNLAAMYNKLGDYDDAIELLETCLEYKKDLRYTFIVYNSLAYSYSSKGKYDIALSYLEKSLEFFNNNDDLRTKSAILQNIGAMNHYIKQYDEAIKYYNQAYIIAKENDFHRTTILAMSNIGLVYQEKELYEEAKIKYKEVLSIAEKLGYLDQQINIYNNLEEASKSQNNYQDAYSYFEKKMKIKDSVRGLQKDKEIKELEVKFNTLQKEKEIKLLQVENTNKKLALANREEAIRNLKLQQEIEKRENENQILSLECTAEQTENENILLKKDQEIKNAKLKINEANLEKQKSIKNTILYSFLIIMIPIIGLLIIYYQKLRAQSELNKKQKEISQQKISTLLKDQELKVIKASVEGQDKERKRIAQELHDGICGNLAAIKLQLNNSQNKTKKMYLETITDQLDDTYHQVRNLSHNLIPKKFINNNFCDVLENYFSNICEASNLTTSFIVYPREEVDLLDETIQMEIFKIIQELITNTIKHARASSIQLQLTHTDTTLNILFEDDGVGFDIENITSGIGFENIKNRLQKISGKSQIDSRIRRGTIINIEIPTIVSVIN